MKTTATRKFYSKNADGVRVLVFCKNQAKQRK